MPSKNNKEKAETVASQGTTKETKKLFRSKSDRMVAGVCGGLGEYFGFDSIWIRLLFVLVTLANGVGILIYIILMIVIPEEKKADQKTGEKATEFAAKVSEQAQKVSEKMREIPWLSEPRNIIGLILVGLGLILLLNVVFPHYLLGWKLFWPAVLIMVGVMLIWQNQKPKK